MLVFLLFFAYAISVTAFATAVLGVTVKLFMIVKRHRSR